MKKKYEIPEAEELRISLEMGLLTTTGSVDPWGARRRDPNPEDFDSIDN